MGIVDVLCGVLLLVPSWRRVGAVVAFVLLAGGLVVRSGSRASVALPGVMMMLLSGVLWVL